MAQTILIKRSNTSNAIPSTSQLSLGELALNTADAKLYMRKYVDGTNANDTITLVGDNSTIAATTLTGNLSIGDNIRAQFGDSNDLQIYHNGSDSYIRDVGTGTLYIDTNGARISLISDGSYSNGKMADFVKDGAVTLYYDNALKIATTSTGINVTGTVTANSGGGSASLGSHLDLGDNQKARFGAGDDLQIYHSGTESIIADTGTGHLYIRGQNLLLQNADGSKAYFSGIGDVASLYYGTSEKLATTATGIDVTGNITSSGQISATTLNATNTGGYGTIEVGGSSGAFIDLKKPASDDYDIRIVTDAGTGGRIQSNGVFDIDAVGDITLDADGGDINLKDNGTSMASFTTSAATFAGSVTATNTILNTGSTTVSTILRGGDGNSKNLVFQKTTGSAQQAKISAVGDDLRFTTGPTTERMRITSTGNVGIGTTAPNDGKLQVYGNSSSDWAGYFYNQNANGIGLHIETDSYGTEQLLRLSSLTGSGGSNTVRMLVRADGNVGIGTTAPVDLLTIQSPASGGGNGITLKRNDNGTDQRVGAISFGNTEDNDLAVIAVKTSAGNNSDGNLEFYTQLDTDTTPTKRMTIASDGSISFNDAFTFPTADGSANQLLKTDGSGNMSWVTVAGSGTPTYIADADNNTKIQVEESADENKIRFDTAGSERMIINATGNVGIGTSAPARKLQVKGTGNTAIAITSPNTAYVQLALGDTDDDNYAQIILDNSSNKLQIQNGGGGVVGDRGITLDSSENVGIGTSSPSSPLHVKGGSTTTQSTFSNFISNSTFRSVVNHANEYGLYMGYANSATDTSAIQSGRSNGTTDKLALNPYGGNVGIGTTAPAQALQVNGSIRINHLDGGGSPGMTAQLQIYGYEGRGAGIKIRDSVNSASNASNREWFIGSGYSQNGFNIGYASDGSQSSYAAQNKLTITTDGKVGLGTSNPAQNFVVAAATNGIGIELVPGTLNYIQAYNRGTSDYGDLKIDAQTIRFGLDNGAEKVRIDSSGKVGIGTSDPKAGFQVMGPATATVPAAGSGVVGGAIFSADLNTYGMHIGSITSGVGYIQQQRTNTATHYGLALQPNGGGVGIGTASPASKLNVYTDAGRDFRVDHGTANRTILSTDRGMIVKAGAGYNLELDTGSDTGSIFFKDNGVTHSQFNASGNLALGTTTHFTTGGAAKLSVAGILAIGASNADMSYIRRIGTGQYQWQTYNNDNTGDIQLQPYGGNVGIGTTTPDAKLRIDQDAAATGLKVTGGSGGTNIAQFIRDVGGNASVNINASGADPQIQFVSAGNTFALGVNSNTFEIADNNALGTNTRFSITNAGNVGIGTSSPTNTDYGSVIPKLHVKQAGTNGAFNLVARFEAGGDAEATGGAILINHSNDRGMLIEGGRDGSGSAADDDGVGHLGLLTSGGDHTRMITLRQNMVGASSVYNVGIGTTAPTEKLHINNGSIYVTPISYAANQDDWALKIGASNNAGWDFAGIKLRVDSGGGPRMSLMGTGQVEAVSIVSGNVGIGTIAPAKTLDVAASGASQGIHLNISGVGRLQMYADGNRNYFKGLSGNGHRFTTTGGANVEILNNGRVGIGTTAPAAKLQVEELGIDTTTTSTSAVTQVAIDSMVAATFRSARYTIQVTNSTDGTYHLTEMLLIHNGTTPSINEFGTIFTGSAAEAVFTADINSGNVRILATPASTDAMAFKVVRHSITV